MSTLYSVGDASIGASRNWFSTTLHRLLHPGRPRTAWVAVVIAAPLLAAAVATGLAWHGQVTHGQAKWHFNEKRAATVLNALVLAGCAVVCGVTERRFYGHPPRRFWQIMTFTFGFLAFDDLFRVHENIDRSIHWLIGVHYDNPATRWLDDVLVLLYGLFVLWVWWRHRAYVAAQPWMLWAMAIGGAGFAAMVFCDLFSAGTTIEESIKLVASASILAALLEPLMAGHVPPRGEAAMV